MRCAGFEERVSRYVGGDLSAEEAALLAQHLRTCVDCADLARGLEEDRTWLASRPPETVEIDFAAMRREMRQEIARPRRGWKWLAVAASILLAAVGLGISVKMTPAQKAAAKPRSPIQSREAASGSGSEGSTLKRSPARRVAPPNRSLARQGASTVTAQNAGMPQSPIRSKAAADLQPPEVNSDSQVAIQIATTDPNVTIILVHESKGVSQ